METNKKLHSIALASTFLILLLALVSSTASAATEQSISSVTYAYITNYDDGTVSVINTATDTVTATVNVGSLPFGVAVNPDGTKVYVTNEGSDTVSVIDTASNKVIATVPVGSIPEGVAVDPTGTKVYVANYDSNTVSAIDTATNTVTATVPVGVNPCGITVTPDGANVYVANSNSDTVSVIDTATDTVTATVPVGKGPSGIAVNSAGTKAYVTSSRRDSTVSVIDTATNKVTATVFIGWNPDGVAVSPDGKKAYVTKSDNTVSVIDTATNTVTAKVSVGISPSGIAVTPDGIKIYVANFYNGTVSVIDAVTNTVTATVPVGNSPFAFGQFIVPPQAQRVLPVADFSAKPTSGKAPLTVAFTDKSTKSPIKWKWNFGDGTTSTKQNPTHKYSKVGSYTVKLTAINAAGTNTKTKTDYIKAVTEPVASFSANPTSGKAPLTVTFTDKSTGSPTEWKWTFGDGESSTKQNPVHKYSKAESYTVALTVTNAAGSNTTTKTDYITVVTKPVANFSADPTSGKAPLIVAFNDTSTGTPTSWKWSFGDGTTSTVQNPVYTYSKEGKYTVILTATNAAGNNTTTKISYINVTSLKAPVAAFSATPTSGNSPLKVQFTDKSTNSPTSWNWSFGDGSTSTLQNPAHTYSKAGKYTVSLIVKNAVGSNTTIKSNYINVVTMPVAAFSASPTSGNIPLKVTFSDKSTGSPTSWKWTFGDGKTSTLKNPAHTYTKAGKYTVSLIIKNAAGSNTKTIKNCIIANELKAPVASFSASPTSGKAPLKVQFTDKSANNPTSWKWSFGDGTYSTSKNPAHKYTKAGKYTVSLTVKNAKGTNTKTVSNYITVKK